MKILAIRIRNLASLEGTTEIDFTKEPLCSAGIFAITGPTGSGKSTILDALCLALYAKTPRYMQAREIGVEIADVHGSSINQSDVRGILRDGTAEGYAEVDFVGIDGRHYRANWNVRRAHGRANGSLQAANTALKNLTNGSDIGGRKSELLPEITRLVGLSYDQFTRSVLLAQGDFTAFLKADKDQKASLLEKLTGTNIYSALSRRIFERHREEDQQLKFLQRSQEGIITLTTAEFTTLHEQQANLATTLERLEVQIDTTTKEIKWHVDQREHQTQIDEAQQILEERVNQKEQCAYRETYLKQVEQIQPTRSWVDAKREATIQLAQRQKAHEEVLALQRLLVQQEQETEVAMAEAAEHLAAQIAIQDDAKPLLDHAKRLDAQLQSRAEEIASAQQHLDVRKAKLEACRHRLVKQQQEGEASARQIATRQHWKEKHANRQPVAENRILIITRLDEARKQLEAADKAARDAAQYVAEITANTIELARVAQHAENLTRKASEADIQLRGLHQELSTLPIQQLRDENNVLSAEIEEIRGAATQWRQVHQIQQAYEALREKVKGYQGELADKETQFTAAVAALGAASEQRKASASMLEKATLAASENTEALRGQLVDGSPCPVCGSESHPYALENPMLNHVLDELKKADQALEKTYNEHLAHHSRLAQAVPLLQQTISALEIDINLKQLELQSLIVSWEAFAVSQLCAKIAPDKREAWLTQRLDDAKARQEVIAQQLDRYQNLLSRREAIRQTQESQHTEQTNTANRVKDLEHAIQTLKERLADAQSVQSANTASLEEVLASLQPNFPDNQWIANWKGHPGAFVDTISAFADEWKKNETALEKDSNKLHVLQATITGIQAEEQGLAADATQAAQELSDKQITYNALKDSRQSIFDGAAAEAVETRLVQQLTDARARVADCEARRAKVHTEHTKIDAAISQANVEIKRIAKRINELSEQIGQWLADYNATQQGALDMAALQALLSHPPAWIAEERAALSGIERAVTQARSVWEERRRQLNQHEQRRPSDQTEDELKQALVAQQALRSESQRDHNQIGYRLKQDEDNRRQLGDLLTAIQLQAAVVENWSKLNEIIGSADGRKFRQVAQEYTLDVLLSYANIHLSVLTQRYRLQRISNTLGLQVLDQDMGDEVRTVYSLSGGESFLVSLALALGLASLSANRMNVESLFIDEGFGSLDPNTLNIAMDALERLHNQGRKVGVISHVQEMTERISVQISVSKEQNGRSRVVVHAN